MKDKAQAVGVPSPDFQRIIAVIQVQLLPESPAHATAGHREVATSPSFCTSSLPSLLFYVTLVLYQSNRFVDFFASSLQRLEILFTELPVRLHVRQAVSFVVSLVKDSIASEARQL